MPRASTFLLTAMLLTVGLAGCIGSEELDPQSTDPLGSERPAFVPEAPEEDLMDMLPVMHAEHQNPEAHTQGVGFSVTGYADMTGVHPMTSQGGWTEVDIHGDLAAVASYYGDAGVTLVDLSDPATPEPISFVPSSGRDYDARFSQDGTVLFFGCQPAEQSAAVGNQLGDCTTRYGLGSDGEPASGLVAYDVSDPADPELIGVLDGVATHNLWTYTVDGVVYAFTNGVEIVRLDPAAEEPLSIVAEVPGGHDAYVHAHPATGDVLLYTTSGNTYAVFNVTDPEEPSLVLEAGPDVVAWHK
ncbi:MAG: hypothetical protein R3185_03265, partial [Candidatus Thermoplasmatota archaeon]|nr:hypothetical protein [Candidatus Thermoplasmatota archaeon]